MTDIPNPAQRCNGTGSRQAFSLRLVNTDPAGARPKLSDHSRAWSGSWARRSGCSVRTYGPPQWFSAAVTLIRIRARSLILPLAGGDLQTSSSEGEVADTAVGAVGYNLEDAACSVGFPRQRPPR